MGKYLTLLLVKVFVISCSITLLGTYVLLGQLPKQHHTCDMSGLAYGVGIGMILFLTLSSSSVFFNLNNRIRYSTSYSLLSFFLPPSIAAMLLAKVIGLNGEDPELYAIIVLPFMLILTVYYLQFRKRLASL